MDPNKKTFNSIDVNNPRQLRLETLNAVPMY